MPRPAPTRHVDEQKGRHRRTGLSTKPSRFPSFADQARHPPHTNVSHRKKSLEQALNGTLATNIALAVLAAATGVIAARILGPDGEGELTAIQTWPLLLGTLSMLGLDSAVVYFIARQPDKGMQFTTTATVIGLLSSMVVGGAAWFALPYPLSAQRAQIVSTARIFLLVGVIFAMVGIPHGSLRGAHTFTAWNLFRIAPGLAWLSILLGFWAFGHPNAIPMSEWYLGGILACGLPFLIVVNRKLKGTLQARLPASAGHAPVRYPVGSHLIASDHQPQIRPDTDNCVPPGSGTWVLHRGSSMEWRCRAGAVSHRIGSVPARICRSGPRARGLPAGQSPARGHPGSGRNISSVHAARAGRPATGLRRPLRPVDSFCPPAGTRRSDPRLGWCGRGGAARTRAPNHCLDSRDSSGWGDGRDIAAAAARLWNLWCCHCIPPGLLDSCYCHGNCDQPVNPPRGVSSSSYLGGLSQNHSSHAPSHCYPSYATKVCELAETLRVTVLSAYPFHMVDQARQLHRAGVLERMITAVPRSRVGLPGELVSTRLAVECTPVGRAASDVMRPIHC